MAGPRDGHICRPPSPYCASTRVAGKATSTSVPLSTRLVMEKQETEVTALFSLAAAGLALLSAALSLLWFNRIL